MASTNGININGAGNVGIGTTTPAHRLSLIGGPTWTSNLFTGALELPNASAIGWQADPGGQRFGIAPTTGGLYFFRTTSNPGTTGSPANFDFEIGDGGELHAFGNAQQSRDKGGWAKAMIHVGAAGNVLACYNSASGSSDVSTQCGMTVTHSLTGSYHVGFPFRVGDRFLSATTTSSGGAFVGINYSLNDGNTNIVDVVIATGSGFGTAADATFMLIIY
jgi:hypothetical protein